MPLESIEIKSFKSIVDQSLELGQVNVFIGANGSGKSNLLEAIGFLSSALSGRIDYPALDLRGVRLSAPEVFKASFRDTDRKDSFSVAGRNNGVRYEVGVAPNREGGFEYDKEVLETGRIYADRDRGGNATIRKTSGDDVDQVEHQNHDLENTKGYIGAFVKLVHKHELDDLDDLLEYAIYSPSTPILRGISTDNSRKEPLGLYGGSLAFALQDVRESASGIRAELKDRFLRLLNWVKDVETADAISPELQSSHVHTARKVVEFRDGFMKETFNGLYAYDASEGALYVLFVLVLLLHGKTPSIFALDNVDSALHPSLARDLMGHITEIAGGDRENSSSSPRTTLPH